MEHSESVVSTKQPHTIHGKLGTYETGEEIAKGGNGKVFDVKILDRDTALPKSESGYVIKILYNNWIDDRQRKKRETRFIREIEKVQFLSPKNLAIIPIFDSYLDADSEDELWYLMPKAETYKYKGFHNSVEKLKDFLQLADTLQRVHDCNCYHRDIKPANLMIYNGRLCLTDFGLVFNVGESERITWEKEGIGPGDIRPPEMEYGAESLRDGIDYEKVDVYLFAKTIWLILTGNKCGFRGQYNRRDLSIYLDRKKMKLGDTLEPLHQMMEYATFYNNRERISLSDCIDLLKSQLAIAEERFENSKLQVMRRKELLEETGEQISCDERIYRNPAGIGRALDRFAGIAQLYVDDYGQKYPVGTLKSSYFDEVGTSDEGDETDDKKRIVKLNLLSLGKNKRLLANVEKLTMTQNTCVLYTVTNPDWDYDSKAIHQLSELQSSDNRMLLNLNCKIHIELFTGKEPLGYFANESMR